MRILVVEDNPVQQALIQTMLESLDYQDVLYAETGLEALKFLRDHQIDVAILDISTPYKLVYIILLT